MGSHSDVDLLRRGTDLHTWTNTGKPTDDSESAGLYDNRSHTSINSLTICMGCIDSLQPTRSHGDIQQTLVPGTMCNPLYNMNSPTQPSVSHTDNNSVPSYRVFLCTVVNIKCQQFPPDHICLYSLQIPIKYYAKI